MVFSPHSTTATCHFLSAQRFSCKMTYANSRIMTVVQEEKSVDNPKRSLPWNSGADMLLFGLIPHDESLIWDRQYRTGDRQILTETLQSLHGNDNKAREALKRISPPTFNHGACDILPLTSRIISSCQVEDNSLFVPGYVFPKATVAVASNRFAVTGQVSLISE